jgi:hypothetical protein
MVWAINGSWVEFPRGYQPLFYGRRGLCCNTDALTGVLHVQGYAKRNMPPTKFAAE